MAGTLVTGILLSGRTVGGELAQGDYGGGDFDSGESASRECCGGEFVRGSMQGEFRRGSGPRTILTNPADVQVYKFRTIDYGIWTILFGKSYVELYVSLKRLLICAKLLLLSPVSF